MNRLVEMRKKPAPTANPTSNVTHTMLRPKIFLATPCFACKMSIPFATSVIALKTECAQRGIEVVIEFIGNESLVERARNVLTAKFMKSDCTHLLFIDADIRFDPSSVFRLLEFDKDVTSCVYSKKHLNWDMIRKKVQEGNPEDIRQAGVDFNLNIAGGSAVAEKGFVRVLDTATGFLMIKRNVIEKMNEHYKEELFAVNDLQTQQEDVPNYTSLFLCMIDPESKRFLSEDYSFCRRWQALGGEIWADLATPLGHIGSYAFVGDYKERIDSGGDDRAVVRSREIPPGNRTDVKKILLALIASDHEMSLWTFISIMNLQTILIGKKNHVFELGIFKEKNDALNVLHKREDLEAALVFNSNVSFPPEFVSDAYNSEKDLVFGMAPIPMINWERVKKNVVNSKTPELTGIVYNASIGEVENKKYAKVEQIDDDPIFFVRRRAMVRAADNHPEIVGEQKWALFAVEHVRDGKIFTTVERFVSLVGEAWVDTETRMGVMAPFEFLGCVGARTALR
jgi:hypothetical protein